jgi:hypothetical protein
MMTAPVRVIAGSKTEITHPGELSEDAKGDLYVANGSSLLVFAHAANGNVAPIRKLWGSRTKIHAIEAMTVDQTTGKIFVFDEPKASDDGESTLLRFAPAATGDEAPYAASLNDFPPAIELANDSTGKNIIEANGVPCCESAIAGVLTAQKQFAYGTDPSVPYGINAFTSAGVADDPTTKTYLAPVGYPGLPRAGIYRLAENTDGAFSLSGGPGTITPAVVSVITSATSCGQLALGYLRNIYAVCGTNAVYVYAHDAKGDVAPIRILHGSATKLDSPYGIYEGQ